ncbi:MAG TPA: cupin domain-containing protein [bacterium]|nr:cupin domain-containing protein [bacterium]
MSTLRALFFTALLIASSTASANGVFVPQGRTLEKLDLKQSLKAPASEEWTGPVLIKNIGGNEHVSAHLVWIRTAEKLHTHAKHDATVMLLKGRGTFWFGGQEIRMKEGDVLTITRGVVHAFRNESKKPAAVYVVFSPPFDGKDVIEAGDVVQ